MAVAERELIGHVFTLDQRDFALYRPARIGRLLLVPPDLQRAFGRQPGIDDMTL